MGILARVRHAFRRDSAPPATSTALVPFERSTARKIFDVGGRWFNPASGLGTAADRHVSTTFLRPFRLDHATLDAIYEFSGIGARICDREPDDAIREGFGLDGFDEPDTKAIVSAVNGLSQVGGLVDVADGQRWARLHGGAALIMAIDDGRLADQPVDWSNLRRLRATHVVDKHEAVVDAWDFDPGSATFLEPLTYRVGAGIGSSRIVHRDRVIPFVGVRLPPRVAMQRNGYGGSVIDRIYAELRNYGSTHEQAAEAIGLLTQGVLKLDGYKELALGGKEGADGIASRLAIIREGMGLFGDVVIDDDDDYSITQRPLNGMKDALEAFVSALVAVSDMPRSVLLGESPGGLNAGENAGEIRSWYDHVKAQQTKIYTPALERIVEVLVRSRFGPTFGQTPDEWSIEWPDLWQPTAQERADTRKTNAEARSVDVLARIITPQEARRDPELREQYELDEADEEAAAAQPEATPMAVEEGMGEVSTLVPLAQASIPPPPGEDLRTAAEIGVRLNVSAGVIRGMHRRNEIRGWRIGARWKYAESQILNLVGQTAVV